MSDTNSISPIRGRSVLRRWPMTLWVGLGIMVGCEVMLLTDLVLTGRGAMQTREEIEQVLSVKPAGLLGGVARFVAINMTPLVWIGYIVFLEGLLTLQQSRSAVRRRPNHFAMLGIGSIIIWCIFDAINFNGGMGAWKYIGMPAEFWSRFWGYLLAFAAIVPGMFMSGQALLNFGLFDWARGRRWRLPGWARWGILGIGAAMFYWPLRYPAPIANLTLWTSLIFLLDPINLMLDRPSVLRDWQNGWYGRSLAAFAGGLVCGLLWEFWNYWALAKWTYDLPFLGTLENIRYFEMPVIGLLGFIPFGMECWVMWQTMRIPLDGLVEPLPDEKSLL